MKDGTANTPSKDHSQRCQERDWFPRGLSHLCRKFFKIVVEIFFHIDRFYRFVSFKINAEIYCVVIDMVDFTATLKQFNQQGEKTGWTYLEVPADIAHQLKPNTKKSFRVKGKLDNYSISGISLLPMGGGSFIMAVNATMRKEIGKKKGAMVRVRLREDQNAFEFNKDFMDCLRDEPAALEFFKTLPGSHQRYFSKWIDGAKTEPTKTKRIAWAVTALAKKQGYAEMLRSQSKSRL
jgi:hypothetical protein